MTNRALCLLAIGFPALGLACSGPAPSTPSMVDESVALSGGDGTAFVASKNAFAQPAQNLSQERRDPFFDGNALFNRNWTTAPASTSGTDGLGPTFNARSCSSCHFKDGRGRPPFDENEPMSSMLIRLSVPGTDEHGGPLPEPTYGGQLNPFGILDVPGEGDPRVVTQLVSGTYDDGTTYELSVPSYDLRDLAYGDLSADVMLSPRTAPQMIGLGLLSAIDEADLLANADPDDANQDGISGRPNRVWDVGNQVVAVGRFGW